MSSFNFSTIPNQSGRIAIVTGANTGLGYETALALAQKDLHVILACRNQAKADAARERILSQVPDANVEVRLIDLSKLASVREFAEAYLATYDRLDLLINNAGVMAPPYTQTEEGFELQMGANYFGHFLLTGLLLPHLQATSGARIVALGSLAHRSGHIDFSDINSEKKYVRMKAYAQSKLACLIHAIELQRRLEQSGSDTLSVAAHPGGSATDLGRYVPKWLFLILRYTLLPLVTQSAADGAQPTLQAALGEDVKGGEYFGPQGMQELKGPSGRASLSVEATDPAVGRRLWELSEQMTGIRYPEVGTTQAS